MIDDCVVSFTNLSSLLLPAYSTQPVLPTTRTKVIIIISIMFMMG